MGDVLWWSGVLIVLLLAAFVGVAQVKKRMMRTDESGGAGFTLSDLRALHREGKMTDDEFEKAKSIIVGAAQKAITRAAEAKKPKPERGRERPLL